MWAVAIQFGEKWVPLFEREYWKKLNALIGARSYIRRAERQQLDPRNIAIFNFARADFEQVPWR